MVKKRNAFQRKVNFTHRKYTLKKEILAKLKKKQKRKKKEEKILRKKEKFLSFAF